MRIASIDRNYCWRGETTEGKGTQIDLLLESKASRTDYVCEMKFTMGKYTISADYEIDLNTKMDAFSESKMHTKTHSIQLVMVTTMGIAQGEHSSVVNQSIIMDDLFRIG